MREHVPVNEHRKGLGKKAILVAMSSDTVEKLGEGGKIVVASVREVSRKESG